MIRNLIIFFSLIFLANTASADLICKDVTEIKNGVSDEVCLAVSDEAEACFAKLNFQFQAFQKTARTLSQKDRKTEVGGLIQAYEEAVSQITGSYSKEINSYNGACDHEAAELNVWVEELEKDLKELELVQKANPTSLNH